MAPRGMPVDAVQEAPLLVEKETSAPGGLHYAAGVGGGSHSPAAVGPRRLGARRRPDRASVEGEGDMIRVSVAHPNDEVRIALGVIQVDGRIPRVVVHPGGASERSS